MSISFSGLASGLDTSSWIESLTALKRAKVETYQAEKQNLLLSQQTLSSIKNFFNSFRSVIEKVTDTKFGTGKLDVFSQNLAVSSKTNILTAIANNDAQEGTYTINVNNLASNTQAVSNYSHITTQTISQTATLGSTLDSLGVNTGRIGVTVNNIERTIRIGNNETIQSFIEKLNNIGAKASYNESTGSFSMNVGTNDIRDIDNTGIINALHLKGINEGYISNALQTAVVDTIYEQANLETKLSELGIVDGSLYLYKYGKQENIYIDSIHQTLNDLISSLNSHGINAELSDDGYLSITENSNLYILSDGATHFFEVMGYDPRDTNKDIVSTSQTSKPLQYTTTLVEGTVADRNTLLKDIKAFNNGDTIIVKNSSNIAKTITLSQTSTIGNVLDEMNSAGLYATMSSEGVVSISDGSIVGGTFDIAAAFNLTEQTTGSSATSNSIYVGKMIATNVTSTTNITHTIARDAQLDDLIRDYFSTDEDVYITIGKNSVGVYEDVVAGYNWTFNDLFNYLATYDIHASLNNGIISITNNGDYYIDQCDLAEEFGIKTISNSTASTVTVATTRTSGTLYYTTTVTATGSSKIADFIECNDEILNGQNVATGTIKLLGTALVNICTSKTAISTTTLPSNTMYVETFDDLFTSLKNPYCDNIDISIENGIIKINSRDGEPNFVTLEFTGSLFEQLGIQTVKGESGTTTKGADLRSTAVVTYTSTIASGTKLQGKDVVGETRRIVDTISIRESDTLDEVFNFGGAVTMNMTIDDSFTGKSYTFTFSRGDTVQYFLDKINKDANLYAQMSGADTIEIYSKRSSTLNISSTVGMEIQDCGSASGNGYGTGWEIFKLGTSYRYISEDDGTFTDFENIESAYPMLSKNAVGGMIINSSETGEAISTYTISVTNGDVSTLIWDLQQLGVGIKVNANGQIELDSSRNATAFVSYISEPFAKLLGLNFEDLTEGGTTAPSTTQIHILSTTSTLGDLGYTGIGCYVTIVKNGTEQVITLTKDTNLYNALKSQGLDVSITDGIFSLKGSSSVYIKDMDRGLKSMLRLGSVPTYTTTTTTTSEIISTGKKITKKNTSTINGNTTLNYGAITIYDHGEIRTVNAFGRDFNDFLIEMEEYGITASVNKGVASFSSTDPENVYILDFGGAFGMYGSGYTTKNQSSNTYYNTSSKRLQKEETVNASWDTAISQINSAFAGGSIIVGNSSTNLSHTITFDKTDTLRDVREKLAVYDIAMDLSGGKVSLIGTNDSYIQTIDSNMRSLFKLNSSSGSYHTTFAISKSDSNCSLYDIIVKGSAKLDFSGNIYVYHNENRNLIQIDPSDTIEILASKFSPYGISLSINNGKLNLTSTGNVYLTGADTNGNNILNTLGINESAWKHNTSYKSSDPIGATHSSSSTVAAARDTKLSDLGVTTGEYLLYRDGVKHTLYVSSDDTLGDFLSTIRSFGIESSLVTNGNSTTIRTSAVGDTYITASNTADKSNIIDKLFGSTNVVKTTNYSGKPEYEKVINNTVFADTDTRLADISSNFIKPGEKLSVTINGDTVSINIDTNETIGSLIDKFNSLGLNASYTDGKMVIQSGYNTLNIQSPAGKNYFTYSSDMGGYSATDPTRPITSTEVIVKENNNSVAKYASDSTKLGLLNISDGNLTIYRNGEKATIDVVADQTFADLRSKISAKFSDVYLRFENGHLVIGSNNADVIVGSTTDSSNFAAITGMHSDENKNSKSSRALYCVNNDSKVTTSGLFVRGNVTEGNFKVGNATINIDKNTTIDDIISQINYNDDSNATAYWDSIDGKFVIKSKTTGASLINIEAGTSNFTNVMGFTFTEDGKTKMNMTSQTLGENARFTINGTNFTSVSNTVGSDISRIQGVTLSLKDISNGETVTLKIEKDSETAATAVSDIVDAYNELIENIDKEIKRGAALDKESTLKLLKNQIRSLMTSSLSGTGTYKNLAQIGISLSAASSGNIRTDNINQLSFDKDKFTSSFKGDTSSLKKLLVGTEDTKGIFTQVEDILEQALGGVTGYFASAEKSYSKKISRLDDKIDKANKAADRYKMRLEAKFKSMDMLISKYQNNYSSFLGK